MGQNIKYILFIFLSDSLVPESARWLAVHGRVDAQKTWKRLLPCNQRDVSNDTDSIKMRADELKCSEYGTGNSSENKVTRNQQTVNNDIIQVEINNIPVDRAVFEYSNTRIQLPVEEGKACKRIMKQEVVKDKLKDCSGWCDNSSIINEHFGILPNHLSNVENRSYSTICKKDGCDSNESQNTHYPEASDSTVEASHFLSCNPMTDCKKNIDETHRMNKKEKTLINGEEMAVTLMYTNSQISSSNRMESDVDKEFKMELLCKECKGMLHGSSSDKIKSENEASVDTIVCSCYAKIRKEIGDSQNSSEHNSLSFCRSASDGLNYICTEAAQDFKTDYAADEVRSVYRKIALGEEYGMVHENEIGRINSIATECNGTNSDTVYDGAVTVNASSKDVSHDDGLIWNNTAKKYKITEYRTATEPKTLDSATKRIGFIELFRSAVLRKYNLTMVFVW
jgi:hypothetical protein